MLTNRNQSRVSISGLTYNNLIQDAYNALKDSEEFRDNFTSFTSNSAERMIVELYAYVASQLANRMDQMGNELFVDTASISGLSRLMKLVGARLDFPAAAETEVEVSTSSATNDLTFTSGINTSDKTLNYVSNSFKRVTANNGTSWEFIKKQKINEDGEFTYDYTFPYTFKAPTQKYILQEGRTQAKSDYIINSTNIDIITLVEAPVIKNSVRVYYKDKVLKEGTANTYEVAEMLKVDNFFTTEALTATTGIYTVRNMGDGKCEISIKPYYNEGTGATDVGKSLLIMYRTGGGAEGNIAIGSIDNVEQFTMLDADGRATGYGRLNITNTTAGNGGKNELTTNEIRGSILQEVRNSKIAITEEDYEYLLPKYDSSIELIKAYGEKNDEIADLSETYGYYVNPLYVWLILLKYSREFYDAYMNDTAGLTDRINDIAFSTLDINPRFNEKYQINSAFLNQVFKAAKLKDYIDDKTNRYTFPIDSEGVKLLAEKGCQITVTNYPYIESADSSRRGINSFKRYYVIPSEITWAELKTLASGTKGDVYIVTDMDSTGEVDNRWECKEDFNHVLTDEEFSEHWERVDFVYIYDNLVSDDVSEDRMYIQQDDNSANVFSPVYSNLPYSFVGDWTVLQESDWWVVDPSSPSGGRFVIENGEQLRLIINGQVIVLDGPKSFEDLQALCDEINNKIDPATSIIFLKENIPGDQDDELLPNANENYVAGKAYMVIGFNGFTYSVEYDPEGVTTYQNLVDRMNEAFEAAGLGDDVLAVIIEANECLNVALISGHQFTYRDGATDGTKAIYTYLLNNAEPEWPISSGTLLLTADQAEDWAQYLSSTGDIASVIDDILYLGFGTNGETTLEIMGDTALASLFKRFFDLPTSTSEAVTRLQRRTLDISYSESSASLLITMTSEDDRLSEDLYINIFGPKNSEIKLGEYYEHIEKYLDAPDVVLDLLRRGPIKHLYSTSYLLSDTNENITDRYGSNYQIKFSTGLIEEQTFNQLSSGNSPAEVFTRNETSITLPDYAEGTKLLIKVDNIEYDGTGSFIIGSSAPVVVPALNGYAEFDLSWFNGKSTLNFINSIVHVFEEQGDDDTPLLKYAPTEDNTLRMYTSSSSYYSSIDFGTTQLTILYTLFGLEDSTVKSREGQIIANEIGYKIFSMTNSLAIGKSLEITVHPSASAPEKSAVVQIGYNLQNFVSNLAASDVGDDVIISDLRLVFTSLENGGDISVKIAWDNKTDYGIWKGMFTPDTWKNFEITGTEDSGYAISTYVNDGDYYIIYDGTNYLLKIQNPDVFPYGDIYFHMYEDYSNDHIVEETDNVVTYTDEYIWNNLMTKKRVMLTEHVYKQPRFIPFDLSVICLIPNNETYSSTDYQKEIADYLRTEYGLYSNNIGEEILPDDIIFNIKEKFPKVKKVIIDYLGYDMTNATTKKEALETGFNQKHILASTEISDDMVVDEETGIITRQTVTKHGLKLVLKYVAS